MLKTLEIDPDFNSPEINFSYETGILRICGKSYLEDAISFYNPIYDWVKKYLENPPKKTLIILNLAYYNTASVKSLMNILKLFEKYEQDKNNSLKVTWRYEAEDLDAHERAEEINSILNFDLNLEAVNSEDLGV